MSIDQQIAKLKFEIEIAENNLKKNVTDLDIVPVMKNTVQHLLSSPDNNNTESTSLISYLPKDLTNKYGFLINILKRVFNLLT